MEWVIAGSEANISIQSTYAKDNDSSETVTTIGSNVERIECQRDGFPACTYNIPVS